MYTVIPLLDSRRQPSFTEWMRRALFFVALLCAVGACLGTPALAAERSPLLQEGKKTLFQRVVTHPGAALYKEPNARSGVVQQAVKPFSVFYIYDKKSGFYEVGPSSTEAIGWMDASLATEWPQAMTLLFTERTGRMPVLFFKEQQALKQICEANDLQARLRDLEARINAARKSKEAVPDLPVIAAEPSDDEGAVSRSRFYLMPIKYMSEPFEGAKFLKVASIDPGTGKAAAKGGAGGESGGSGGSGSQESGPQTMRTGIVFVIDTTISMRPYIEQSLNVIRSAFDNIEKNKLGDSVGFAVIAYRNSTKPNPKVEYTTLKVSDFTTLKDRQKIEKALAGVEEATASTHSYDEDAMAGIKAAVDELDWEGYHSRVMVLITDAGPLPLGDPLGQTRMSTAEMRDYAKAKNIWITAVHIKAPRGKNNHAYAEKSYRDLTRLANGSSSYMTINAPTPAAGAASFAKTTKALTDSLTKVVQVTASRKLPDKPKPPVADASPEDEARRIGETLGYAMQLEFIGLQRDNRAPSVVDAWIADVDLVQLDNNNYSPTVEAAVLLTKNQLSDLQRTLQIIVEQAERTKKTDSRDFFQSILSASAQLARDPAAFSAKPGQNLQQTGVLGEFLEGLPYKSDIMLLTEEDWYRMSIGEQTAFINRLKSRIARYEEYDKDRSNWESFGAANSGDWLYRVPLSVLP